MNIDRTPEVARAEGEEPGAEEGADGAVAPAVFE